MGIWYTLWSFSTCISPFGKLYQQKSGNPGLSREDRGFEFVPCCPAEPTSCMSEWIIKIPVVNKGPSSPPQNEGMIKGPFLQKGNYREARLHLNCLANAQLLLIKYETFVIMS
jgi:hypothetical protein